MICNLIYFLGLDLFLGSRNYCNNSNKKKCLCRFSKNNVVVLTELKIVCVCVWGGGGGD